MRLFSSALSLLMLVGTHAQYNQAAAEAAAAQTAAALAAAGASGGSDAVDAILGAAASGSLADVIGAALSGSGTSLTDAIAAASSAAAALTAGGAGASESQIRTYYESLSALCSDKATLVGSLTSATFNGLPNTGLVELADYVCNGGFDAAAMAAWSVSGQQAASRVADSAGVAIPSALCTPKGKAYLLAIGSYRGPAEVAADAVVECYCANYNSAEMFNDVIGGTVPSAVDAVFSQVPSMDVRSALCASTHCAGLLDYFSESAKTETIRARGQAASNAAALLGADAGSGSRAPAAIAPPPRGFGCSSIPVRGENKRTSVRMLAAGDVADFTRDVLAVIEQACVTTTRPPPDHHLAPRAAPPLRTTPYLPHHLTTCCVTPRSGGGRPGRRRRVQGDGDRHAGVRSDHDGDRDSLGRGSIGGRGCDRCNAQLGDSRLGFPLGPARGRRQASDRNRGDANGRHRDGLRRLVEEQRPVDRAPRGRRLRRRRRLLPHRRHTLRPVPQEQGQGVLEQLGGVPLDGRSPTGVGTASNQGPRCTARQGYGREATCAPAHQGKAVSP